MEEKTIIIKSLDGNYFVHVDDRNLYVGEFPANAKFKIYTGKNDDKTIIENEDFEITFKDKIDYYSAKEFFIETYLHMKEMTSGYVLKSESFTMKLKSDLTDELVEYAIEDVLTSLTDELFKKYATVVYRDRGGLAK